MAFDIEILRRIEHILAPLEAHRDQALEVLDLGCGEGRYLRWLMAERPRWKVTGVDPIAPSRKDLPIDLGSAVSIPRGDASTDAVYACVALQHVDDVEVVMREVARILRPGGIFIVFDRNPRSLRGVLKPWHELKGRWLYGWDAPFRERWHTRVAWSQMFERAGFKIVARQSMTHSSGSGIRRILPINRFVLVAGRKQADPGQALSARV